MRVCIIKNRQQGRVEIGSELRNLLAHLPGCVALFHNTGVAQAVFHVRVASQSVQNPYDLVFLGCFIDQH